MVDNTGRAGYSDERNADRRIPLYQSFRYMPVRQPVPPETRMKPLNVRPLTYILNAQGEPVPATEPLEWALWKHEHRAMATVGAETLPNGWFVSTVFLGVDQCFIGTGPPVLWETMVFDNHGDPFYREQYASRAEAQERHGEIVIEYSRRDMLPSSIPGDEA